MTPPHDIDSDADEDRRAGFGWVIVATLAIALLALHARLYLPFISDDSLISLRYARRLLDGHGLSWTQGAPVEGYSNLLWILLCAAAGRMGLDLIVAARLLGVVGMAAVIGAIAWSARSCHLVPLSATLLMVALTAPVAVWAIGGMEQPLVAALLAWSIVLLYSVLQSAAPPRRVALGASILLGLLCVTRPDGVLFTVAAVVAVTAGRGLNRETMRLCAWLVVFPLALVVGQMVFRLVYFDDWIPNTARVKLSPSGVHLQEGVRYVTAGCVSLAALLVPAVLMFKSGAAQRKKMILLGIFAAIWLVYVIGIGGDIFPGYRHLVPIVVVGAFAFELGVQRVWKFQRRSHRGIFVAVGAVFICAYAVAQWHDAQSLRARNERWEWYGKSVGEYLKHAFGDTQALLAVTASGCLPYWSELPSLDMLGLNDRVIARDRPDDFGQGRSGHELGSGDYVLRRRPDIIFFGAPGPSGGRAPVFRAGREMIETDEFFRSYVAVRVSAQTPSPFSVWIWVRWDSDKIGGSSSADDIVLPAYLLNANPDTVNYLSDIKTAVTLVTPEHPAIATHIAIPAGDWDVVTRPQFDTVRGDLIAQENGGFTVRIIATSPAEIDQVTIRRRSD